jgi:hypothetical protein
VSWILSKGLLKRGEQNETTEFTVFDVELRRNEGFSVFSNRIWFNGNN